MLHSQHKTIGAYEKLRAGTMMVVMLLVMHEGYGKVCELAAGGQEEKFDADMMARY